MTLKNLNNSNLVLLVFPVLSLSWVTLYRCLFFFSFLFSFFFSFLLLHFPRKEKKKKMKRKSQDSQGGRGKKLGQELGASSSASHERQGALSKKIILMNCEPTNSSFFFFFSFFFLLFLPDTGKSAVVMQKHPHVTLERIEKFLSPIYFADVNLCADLVKHQSQGERPILFFLSFFLSFFSFRPEHLNAIDAVTLSVQSFTARVTFSQAIKGQFNPTKVRSLNEID
jgi:hypothetical protein